MERFFDNHYKALATISQGVFSEGSENVKRLRVDIQEGKYAG
jgi:hypothetical protein